MSLAGELVLNLLGHTSEFGWRERVLYNNNQGDFIARDG